MADPGPSRWQRWSEEISRPSSTLCLIGVPREVLFVIQDQLPDHARVALSLACKYLYTSLNANGRLPPLSESHTTSLLNVLQRDLPDLYLCFGCRRLLHFDPKAVIRSGKLPHSYCGPEKEGTDRHSYPRHYGFDQRAPPSTVVNLNRFVWKPHPAYWQRENRPLMEDLSGKWPEIEFSQAQQVMNGHLPIESLERTFEFKRVISPGGSIIPPDQFPPEHHAEAGMTRWSVVQAYSAQNINDELLISRSHRVSGPLCTLSEFLRVIDTLELPVCGHLYAATRRPYLPLGAFPWNSNGSIPELLDMWLAARRKHTGTEEVYTHEASGDGACKTCFTDYSLIVENGDGDDHWRLNLTTYHDLGSCQDPDEPKWRCLTMSSDTAFRRKMLGYRDYPGPGENVFLKWHGILDVKTEVEGVTDAEDEGSDEDEACDEDDGGGAAHMCDGGCVGDDGGGNADNFRRPTLTELWQWARHCERFVEPFQTEIERRRVEPGGCSFAQVYADEIAWSVFPRYNA